MGRSTRIQARRVMSFTEPIIPNPDWGNPFPSVIPDWDDDDDDD